MPKRLAITGPYEVEVMDYEDGLVPEKHVLVKTELASGKHGTTTAMFDGSVFRDQIFDPDMRLFIEQPPKREPDADSRKKSAGTSGTTGVGVIVEVVEGVTKWKKGERIFGRMDVRETNICHEDNIYTLGDIEPTTALCVEPAYVSIHCIRESNLRYGDSVAIIGLGAIGCIAVEMAAASGAEMVIVVDPLSLRREWALKNGADFAFDPGGCDAGLEVHRATGGKGVDIAIEVSGSYSALNTAIRCTRICGTVCSAGFYQGESKGLWLGREWHHNRLSMVVPHGCGWGHPPRDYPVWDGKRANDVIVGMMRKGALKLRGLIDPIVPLEKGQEIFTALRNNPNSLIKYAVRFA